MKKNLKYYLGLDYTVQLKRNYDGTWFAKIHELPGCMTEGDTPEQALKMIRDAQRAWIKSALADQASIPEPHSEKEFSGRFVVRVPRSLHRTLVEQAKNESVSLNQLVNVTLSHALSTPLPRAKLAKSVAKSAVRR